MFGLSPPSPSRGKHYATFPEALVEPCVLAGTSAKGVCAGCGKPWQREMERTGHVNNREPVYVPDNVPTKTDSTNWAPLTRPTGEWIPTCKCNVDVVPGTVLDCFVGSGTTGVVALRHGRNFVGIELNSEYVEMARNRIVGDSPLLNVELPLPRLVPGE